MLEINSLINEKRSELERYSSWNIFHCVRYTIEYESLLKVEAEQKALIDRLSNNEV
jgi:hypothetical protein